MWTNMQCYYRINVTRNGRYLFATEQGGLTYGETAKEIFKLFKEKFPESEGYKISVAQYVCRAEYMDWEEREVM